MKISNLKSQISNVIVIVSCILFAGCKDDNYLGGHFTEDYGGVPMSLHSVIASTLNPSLKWQEGDTIALTTSYTDNTSLNRFYVCGADGKTFTPLNGLPIYIKGTGILNAYAPVSGKDGEENVIAVNTLQQATLMDYLIAQTAISTDSQTLSLSFNHALAQLQVAFDITEGEKVKKVQLQGLYHQAVLDLYTSVWSVSEVSEPYAVVADVISALTLNLLPQKATNVSFVLTTDKREYSIPVESLSLTAGQALRITLHADADGSSVAYTEETTGWQDSGLGTHIVSE
jgi:hypothetical protein